MSHPDWKQRVIEEHAELRLKIRRLRDFLQTPAFSSLETEDKDLLRMQYAAMCDYSRVLGYRIDRIMRLPDQQGDQNG